MAWHKPILLTVEGETYTLAQWAERNGVHHSSAYYQWQKGVRDPYELLYGPGGKRIEFSVTKADLDYLFETWLARSGQEDEWDIACDLIGMPRIFKNKLKQKMEATYGRA